MRLSHDGGREEGTGKRVMFMFKRLLCLMVSCVFISMVCIPAAHADDVSGSIDLNVQPSPAEPRKMAHDGGAEVHDTRKFHDDTDFKFKYCFMVEDYETHEPVSAIHYSAGSMSLKASEPNAINLNFNEDSNVKGKYCYSFNGKTTDSSWKYWTNDIYDSNGALYDTMRDTGDWKTKYGEAPDIWCQMNRYYGYLISCHGDDDKKDNVKLDSTGIVSTVYLRTLKPEHKILSSFPMTGKYTLSIVISLVLIAGITIIFIRRYGRK